MGRPNALAQINGRRSSSGRPSSRACSSGARPVVSRASSPRSIIASIISGLPAARSTMRASRASSMSRSVRAATVAATSRASSSSSSPRSITMSSSRAGNGGPSERQALGHHDRDRRIAGTVRHEVEQSRGRAVRPVPILELDHQWAFARRGLDRAGGQVLGHLVAHLAADGRRPRRLLEPASDEGAEERREVAGAGHQRRQASRHVLVGVHDRPHHRLPPRVRRGVAEPGEPTPDDVPSTGRRAFGHGSRQP